MFLIISGKLEGTPKKSPFPGRGVIRQKRTTGGLSGA
jgi:hypothetical protein